MTPKHTTVDTISPPIDTWHNILIKMQKREHRQYFSYINKVFDIYKKYGLCIYVWLVLTTNLNSHNGINVVWQQQWYEGSYLLDNKLVFTNHMELSLGQQSLHDSPLLYNYVDLSCRLMYVIYAWLVLQIYCYKRKFVLWSNLSYNGASPP